MKATLFWLLLLSLILFNGVHAQEEEPPPEEGAEEAPAEEGAEEGAEEEEEDPLEFIDDGIEYDVEVDGFRPKVMIHNDARDVLRKLVKEKDTAFIIQFYKGAPDRDLREDLFRYVFIPKEQAEDYQYDPAYEYAEIDVDNPLYKDLMDNLSFKKKYGDDDYPYVLYTFQGQGYMIHGPGTAREVFDLRTEVEAEFKAQKEKEAAAAEAAAAEEEAAAAEEAPAEEAPAEEAPARR